MEFPERLQTYRKRAGLTQGQVADALGVTTAAVASWENGRAVPRTQKMTEIAEVLGVSVSELLGGRDTDDLPWDEAKLLECYRACPPEAKVRILMDVDKLSKDATDAGGGRVIELRFPSPEAKAPRAAA